MANHLTQENSPYLLQHAGNPVDWYPWGPEALEKARQEDKPIFLSIGYAACHWCHVMAHESFEDESTAALMNQHFVNIKVDREERPDLDSIYMNAVVAMTGQGGWPMSVFLTPDLQPFFGGTYFPPVRRYNMPSFKEVLSSVLHAWQNSRPEIIESGENISAHLRQAASIPANQDEFNAKDLEKAAFALAQGYDWQHGGWGQAPKFPQPMAIDFLLRCAQDGDKMAGEMAVHALRAMSKGGMYDVVGGGFARYSTDNNWLVPHFEKMLYDNALLSLAYLHGHLVTGEAHFRSVCEETLGFILREMTSPEGGFYSSLDADSEGEEGKFYLWDVESIRQALGPEDAELVIAAYGVLDSGNFEGRTILQRVQDDAALAQQLGIPIETAAGRLTKAHARLLAARAQRVRPATDDKVLVSWNSLMLTAFSEAARYLAAPGTNQSSIYLEAARKNALFLLSQLSSPDGRLQRSWRRGQARHLAFLEDYAALILGLLSLYQSDPDVQWYASAVRLAEELIAGFSNSKGGFYDTHAAHETLLLRPSDVQDNATPSGSALAAMALLQLAAFSGRSDFRSLAEDALGSVHSAAVRYPTAFSFWLQAADFAVGPAFEAAIVGPLDDQRTQALRSCLWSAWQPRLVAAISAPQPPPGAPSLLEARPLVNDQPAAYICQHFVCQRPVTTPEQLQDILANQTPADPGARNQS
jgi:hypothetical protein